MRLWLGLIFISQIVQARVTTENLVAPNGYRWESAIKDDKIYLNLIAQDLSRKTNVTYAWVKSGARILEKPIDSQFEVVTVKPGRHIWEPHPGTQRSLEEIFLILLKSLGYKTPSIEYVKFDGTPTFSTIDDFLKELQEPDSKITLSEFIKEISKKVANTRRDIQKKILPFNSNIGIPQFLDIVEPIEGEENGRPRYDAFNLIAVNAYLKHGDDLLNLVKRLGDLKVFNPLFFYLRNHTVPEDLKQVIIALLTHNHLIETNLVRAVILKHGHHQGWLVFKAINNLYAAERNWWISGRDIEIGYRASLKNRFYETGIDFIDRLNEKVVLPRFLDVSCTDVEAKWIPVSKIYHLYGAFLVSLRMKNLGMANWMVDVLTPKLGSFYKTFSKDNDQEKLNLIKEIYSQGAAYANRCH